MAWTEAQQKVIDTRKKNLLVSAAAGSGKTAVLVERIISMISEGEQPLDIDRLLVVTFTNAAAAEMRGRIGKAIDEKLRKEPDSPHLQKQVSLLQSAQITTIHSFCLNVIRNYFHRIDLDPAFKIAEESEITLMKSDVISDLLERWYEEGRDGFHDFIESYSYSKSDAPVEELILQLYNFSMSDPWPKDWIDDKRKMFEINTIEEMLNTSWMKDLTEYVNVVLEDLYKKNEEAMAICNEPDGPAAYQPALLSDRSILEKLRKINSYVERALVFKDITYDRLSGKKEEGVAQWKKDRVKELRDEIKKGIKDLTGQFFFQSPEEMLKDLQAVSKVMEVLFDLTLDFMEEFAKKKEEKNLIDFNDLEHYALKILVTKQEGQIIPTQAALELGELFEEILIDEYQDSNMVQETILRSISREEQGQPNRFMVGDVKQSIYKFRLAMPEIFMEKYENYSSEDRTEEGQINYYQRIDLDKNFRSRKIVLDYVNKIFEQIMQKPVGGIHYDEAASLKYGELYEDPVKLAEVQESFDAGKRIASDIELLLVTEDDSSKPQEQSETESTEDAAEASQEEAIYTKKELEARAIAEKIKELTDPVSGMLVYDKSIMGYRTARYCDIVILLRSMANWSEVFVNSLVQEGIPAYADTGTGYFQTLEIMTILNLLRIIDNPRQDIPLAGVLYSPMVGLTSTELAEVRAADRKGSLFTALISYASEGNDGQLKERVEHFIDILNNFRSMVSYKPIHELIQLVLDQTGYYYYVSAMPGGDQRKANIDMLISQAVRFEKGSYTGLFHFIRYIEKLHQYEVDFGEAATTGEQDNTVRIMSIHKSKGLEFPVVFVAGMSKQFNNQDLRNSIVLHNELGAGPEYIDCKLRTKVPTLIKKVIQKKVQIENLGEELRVLYVAMTRAKEKLILTGYLDDPGDIKKEEFSFFELLSSKCYLDWVLPATVNKTGWIPEEKNDTLTYQKDGITITVLYRNGFLQQEIIKQSFLNKDEEELLSIDPAKVYNQQLKEELFRRLNYDYPHENEAGLKVKMTVSELKKLGQQQDEELSVNLYQKEKGMEETKAFTIPNFIRQKEADITGTDRGTLYHKVLELIDLSRTNNEDDVRPELTRLLEERKLNEEDIKMLKLDYIKHFISSNIAGRMRKAGLKSKLFKEKQFVIGIKASEVMQDSDSEELILIQGIIDVFFEEDGELVLLDYKSDLVTDEEQLVKRYKVQLEYYRRALEQMLKKNVKEMIIYSLPLAKEIRING